MEIYSVSDTAITGAHSPVNIESSYRSHVTGIVAHSTFIVSNSTIQVQFMCRVLRFYIIFCAASWFGFHYGVFLRFGNKGTGI
jgi:hypothetical protein